MNHYITDQIHALNDPGIPAISRLANMMACLYWDQEAVNWAGLYLHDAGNACSWLGPFCGKPACSKIPDSTGVIGSAIRKGQTERVEDVHQFPGHIACDCASRSEIVIPLFWENRLVGVLDLDSSEPAFFSEEDQRLLEEIAGVLAPLAARLTV